METKEGIAINEAFLRTILFANKNTFLFTLAAVKNEIP
jgi:hypothetical protein